MAHPDFRVNGRIFATIAPDAKWGMVQLSPEQQQEFVAPRRRPSCRRPGLGPQRLHDGATRHGRRRHRRRSDDARLAGTVEAKQAGAKKKPANEER